MKLSIIPGLLGLAFSISACGQKLDASNVPAPVKESFAKHFPSVKSKWVKEDTKYEAAFDYQGNEMSATFEADGTMTESEMEVKITDLPAKALDYIKTQRSGAKVKEAARITLANGDVQYEAEIKGLDLIFDSNGNFIKEVKQ